jgi:hypothetical protein
MLLRTYLNLIIAGSIIRSSHIILSFELHIFVILFQFDWLLNCQFLTLKILYLTCL